MADPTNDVLPAAQDNGFQLSWDWKGGYMGRLAEDGYERFAQYSATPDTTLLFAGPARFTGLSGDASVMFPIGLTDGLSYATNPQLTRLFELGSNRSYFTRGKSTPSLRLGKMLADTHNILAALSYNAYRPPVNVFNSNGPGPASPNPDIMLNLDSEYFGVPFGLMVVLKTRGGGDGTGKPLTGCYLEYCMFESYQFDVNTQSPVIQEGITIQFDRLVPVSFN